MKNNLFLGVMVMAVLWSCSKDDDPAAPEKLENSAPKIEAQSFVVKENISDDHVVGNVYATDGDITDNLIFKITDDTDALFEITEISGAITLRAGKNLDFDATTIHKITVEVFDGTDKASAEMTINVANFNVAPVIDKGSLNFEIIQNVTDLGEIGVVKVIDEDEDPLSFQILANAEDDLFVISDEGVVSLAEGKSLNNEIVQYIILIGVHDGLAGAKAEVTINVIE